jgi:hypothetical protein
MGTSKGANPMTDPIKESIRQELEETRAQFHQLLQSIPAADFARPSANPAWTVAEILFHMSVALRFLPEDVQFIRRFGWLPKPPAFLFHRFNVWFTRRGARNAIHPHLAEQYDQAHARTLQALDTVGETEWTKGAEYPGWDPALSGHVTLEDLFHYPTHHFHAHRQDLESVLEPT